MDLTDYRAQIDEIDHQLVELFARRMQTAAQIAAWKKENGMPVLDAGRERKKLAEVSAMAPEDLREQTATLYGLLFELSRAYQTALLGVTSPLPARIQDAIARTPQLFPTQAAVACQGVEGAYSQQACDKLFRTPNIFYCATFDAVFSAIESGLCRYGVIPLENSTAGSVNAVYDLMQQHQFHIVRSVRLKIDHCLLANRGAKLSDIREIRTHEQAVGQCGEFLRSLGNVKIVPCENTAVAAREVAESGRTDVAALASRSCAALYGLSVLRESVQNQGNNYTRFICISRDLEIYPGADRTSLMMVLRHRPGSLAQVLSRFYAHGINLNKLESRPIAQRDFEFMFYFDLDAPVYAPQFLQLMGELDELSDSSCYLGSYSEVI